MMKKVLFCFVIIQLLINSKLFANEKIFNLKNCYDTSSKISLLAEKNFSWNINLAINKITETYNLKNKSESKIWNIVSNDNGIITAEVDQARTDVPKSLLIILVKDKQVVYLNHSGLNYRYQCK
jgi:hypothetical protein